MKTQFGELVTGDFKDNTLTIEINGEMEIQAGRYAVVPIDDYNRLVKKCDLADVGESCVPEYEVSKREILLSLNMAHDNLTKRKYKNAKMGIGIMIRMLEREMGI